MAVSGRFILQQLTCDPTQTGNSHNQEKWDPKHRPNWTCYPSTGTGAPKNAPPPPPPFSAGFGGFWAVLGPVWPIVGKLTPKRPSWDPNQMANGPPGKRGPHAWSQGGLLSISRDKHTKMGVLLFCLAPTSVILGPFWSVAANLGRCALKQTPCRQKLGATG